MAGAGAWAIFDPMRMLARLPLRERRRAAAIVATGGRLLGRMPVLRETVMAISERTGHGVAASHAAAKRVEVTQLGNALDWIAFSRRGRAGLARDLRRVRCASPTPGGLAELGRSVVLAGVHSGSLPLAIGAIAEQHFAGWPIVIVKTTRGDADERLAADRLPALGADVTVLALDDRRNSLDVLRRARTRTLIVCMADLPGRHGKPRQGRLFWHPATLAGGAMELARACRAFVLPFASRSHGRSEEVAFGDPIDAGALSATDLRGAEDALDRWVSDAIVAAPEQWHLWSRIDEFRVARAR